MSPVNIVPKDSWIRSFSSAIDPEFRLVVDSLLYSADAISCAFNLLCSSLSHVNVQKNEDRENMADVFLFCWSIVDEINAVLNMLKFYKKSLVGVVQKCKI